ncbi:MULTISPECIES: 50S ribosomal protein L29 [Leptospira]|uniref:Large ribosomal subunit protein uL29 n=1 Tax=Leptospira mtsangambouensis TaxID=2484912 RepID=A0ABY2P435_9LEPT|nr:MULTISPECIES: 50S ribosomal protein L29 [Leptospira]MCG6142038.1 50S ribosomal protein L29 [Leptospira mtsangambouensis]MCW7482055.1 50S ribosomal protein L29 [Leptospira kanakyensis]TGM82211.1 50S ribosomal protein L29 [Leptospira mtsangambouensis]
MKDDFKSLSPEDLKKEILSSSEEVRKARFQFGVTRSLENPKQIRNHKKRIAQALTVLREKELAAKGKLKQIAPKAGSAPKAAKTSKGKKK